MFWAGMIVGAGLVAAIWFYKGKILAWYNAVVAKI